MNTSEKRKALEAAGFIVGARDPRINTDYKGQFMVVEQHEDRELPTRNGANGPWAIVGDNRLDSPEERQQFVKANLKGSNTIKFPRDTKAWSDGYRAWGEGKPVKDNPYTAWQDGYPAGSFWVMGWEAARRDSNRE